MKGAFPTELHYEVFLEISFPTDKISELQGEMFKVFIPSGTLCKDRSTKARVNNQVFTISSKGIDQILGINGNALARIFEGFLQILLFGSYLLCSHLGGLRAVNTGKV